MSDSLTRRRFLGSSAVLAATAGLAKAAERGANETLRLALIGAGGQGVGVARRTLEAGDSHVQLVALADPDRSHRERATRDLADQAGAKIEAYNHFGKIIERKDIDVVIVATPDHWHAIPTLLACQAGKDVYVEKPCSHNIAEGRAMVRAARKYKRIVQVGQQQRSDAHFGEAVKYLKNGQPLGRIARTMTMNFENLSRAGIGNPPDQDAPPDGVDYDLWLGPAPKRRFNPNRFHGDFRWFFDYAAGMLGDWNVHLQDIMHWAMNVDAPRAVTASGGKMVLDDNSDTPDILDVIYEYPGFIHVYTMGRAYQRGGYGNNFGTEFFGENGSLFIKRSHWQVVPEESPTRITPEGKPGRIENVPGPRIEGFRKPGTGLNHVHQKNWLDAVRSRRQKDLACDIEVGHRTATACHLGNIALKLGRKIWWDREAERITRADGTPDAEANVHLTREYRKGYEIPQV